MRPIDRLIEGVRNRSLWQVAGLYAAGAWVALQVVDVLSDAFDLPGRFAAIALVLLISGFPVVLATAYLQHRRSDMPATGGEVGDQGADSREGAEVPGARRLLTWRNVFGSGVALFAIWGIVVTGWLLTREGAGADPGPSLDVSRSVVAVLPFSVRGSTDFAHLGEGMVNLLGIKLDGAGDLRSVDSRALLSHIAREGVPADDPAAAAAVAERFGAGLFVMGDVVEGGRQLQVSAALYRTGDWTSAVAEASAEGEEPFALVDDVATQLLAGVEGGPGARVRKIAAVTTSSLPAFRAYLEGEAAFRTFDFQTAFDAFQRAVALDTLYAMAYYRLSVAAEWLTRADEAQEAAETAFRHASRLTDRDRQLLEAFRAWRRGEHPEAERGYRAIVGTYPTDVEAWFQLGEVLTHSNPFYGRSFAEAREPFERVLEYEPRDMAALVHLIRIAAFEGRLERLDSLATRFLEINPDADRQYEVRTMQVLAHGDSEQTDSLLAAYRNLSDLSLSQVAWNGTVFTRNHEAGEKAAALLTDRRRFTPEVWTTGHSMRAYSLVSRGHVREAMAEVDSIATYDAFSAKQLEAFLHLVPAVPADRQALERLLSQVEALDPAAVVPSGNPSFFYNVLEKRHEIIQLYLAGALSARLGDAEAAREYAERLGAAEPPPEGGSVTFDLAAGLRSMAARAEGDLDRALAALDEIRMDIFYQMAMASPYDALVLERFARGSLLQELGRYAEAVGWLENIGSVGAAEVALEPGAALRLAQIYESMGEPARATEQYARFVAMWRDADPELQPVVEEAQAALRRLSPDGAPAD
jgi:tetratricopeptide (TPR) repeat protein